MASLQQAQALIDGKYQLVRRLGEGGMGSVYEARHLGTGRRVAVKMVSPEVLAKGPDIAERFRREAMASGAIESQYIAHVLDTGVDAVSASPYIVMELLVGEDLQHTLVRVRRFTPDIALRITAHACMGLQKAHDAGVIHRDVKPANLYLTRRDHEVVVKLLDFGIAKVRADPLAEAQADRTHSGMMLGSPLYMSPEQARGKKTIDHRSDVFSLGVVLYEMLTGKTPNAKSDSIGDLIVRICSETARPVRELAPSVSAPAAAIVHKALEIDVAARFASAAEMLAAIRALVPGGLSLDANVLPLLPDEPSRNPAPSSAERPVFRAPAASRPDVTPPVPVRAPMESASTIAHTPLSKSEPKGTALSTGSGRRPVPTTPPLTTTPLTTTEKSATPARPAAKQEPAKEALQRRIYVPALKRAAVLLWGDDGLNAIAGACGDDAREEFFRTVSADEWVGCRHVIEWCLRAFEGPCKRDRNKMAEYVDRAYDFSYGVVRKFIVRLADPASIVPRLPAFWKQDHSEGELASEVDASGKGCTIRVTGTPYVDLVHSRAGMAETYRYGFSQTRAKKVTESHALERATGKQEKPVLVIKLRWQ